MENSQSAGVRLQCLEPRRRILKRESDCGSPPPKRRCDTRPSQTPPPTDSRDSSPTQEANTFDSPAQDRPQSELAPAFGSALPPANGLVASSRRSQSLPARWRRAYSDPERAQSLEAKTDSPSPPPRSLSFTARPSLPRTWLDEIPPPNDISTQDATTCASPVLDRAAQSRAGCSTEGTPCPETLLSHQSRFRGRTPPASHSIPLHPSRYGTSSPAFNYPFSKLLRATEPVLEADDTAYEDKYEGDNEHDVCLKSIHEACTRAVRGPCLAPVKPDGHVNIHTDPEALWAREFGDAHEAAHVEVWDISRRGGEFPPNVIPMSHDVEEEWNPGRIFDFIFMRDMSGWGMSRCIRDWGGLMKNSYDNLAPEGWAEIHILGNTLYLDDGTIDEPFVRLFNALGLPSSVPDLGSLAREAGFAHVSEETFMVPLGNIFTPSSSEACIKLLTEPLKRRWQAIKVEMLRVDLRRVVRHMGEGRHPHFKLATVTAQKPNAVG